MMDSTARGPAPGDPPDRVESWAAKASRGGGRLVPEEVLEPSFVSARMKVDYPNGINGEPVFTIAEEVIEAMHGLWKQCMVVKVLGRNVPIPVLTRKLKELWKPQGAMYVTDLPRQFFMVRFEVEDEYLTALTGGPWKAFGSYLMVRAWSPEFEPSRDDIVTTPVWVRFSNLPVALYHQTILLGLAQALGKPLRVDTNTLNFERARFPRVCVEVDLSQPLKGSFMLNGERYFVFYEGLTSICSGCGIFGHMVHACPKLKGVAENVGGSLSPVGPSRVSQGPPEVDGFTMVRRGNRRGGPSTSTESSTPGTTGKVLERNQKERSGSKEKGTVLVSNSFAGLVEETSQPQVMEVFGGEGGNKENEMIGISQNNGKNIFKAKEGQFERGTGIGKKGAKGVLKERSVGPIRPGVGSGSRSKFNNRPTRGYLFGPTSTEVELSTSGKRLRMEGNGFDQTVGSPNPVTMG
ncbi:hypothetical protein CARUB_v10028633mg, partial [Capsella rubella]